MVVRALPCRRFVFVTFGTRFRSFYLARIVVRAGSAGEAEHNCRQQDNGFSSPKRGRCVKFGHESELQEVDVF